MAKPTSGTSQQVQAELRNLETLFEGRIGIYAIDTNNNNTIAYRENERFPLQSTLKLMGVASLLKLSEKNEKKLQETVHYSKKDLVFWHPVTGKNIQQGMSLKALARAAIVYSDNPAINLIMKKLGGPKAINVFAHSIGNDAFNLVHYEGHLNSNPAQDDDTSTAKAMAVSVKNLILGNILNAPQRTLLMQWMIESTTGYKRIQSGVPRDWVVADKTGSGDYGIANDIGLVWSHVCKPIVISIYTAKQTKGATPSDAMVAQATKVIMNAFAKANPCFEVSAS